MGIMSTIDAGYVALSCLIFQLDDHLPPAEHCFAHDFRTFRLLIAAMDTQGIGTDIVILSAVRTPCQDFGDTLRDIVDVDLTVALKVALAGRRLPSIPWQTFELHSESSASSHPWAPCKTRISSRLPRTWKLMGKKYALGAACVGGSQGGASVPEALA